MKWTVQDMDGNIVESGLSLEDALSQPPLPEPYGFGEGLADASSGLIRRHICKT